MLSWLVLQLTDSPAMVSLVGFSRMLPMFLFGLVGGSLADRFAKKRVMLASQAISVATYVTMAGLLFLDIFKPWHAFATIFLTGTAFAIDFSARRAFFSEILDETRVVNAVSLDVIALTGSQLLGALLGGFLVDLWGFRGTYLTMLVGTTGALFLMASVSSPVAAAAASTRPTISRQLLEAVRVVRDNPTLRAVLLVTIFFNFFATPFMQMVPVIARDVLGLSSTQYGVLAAATGIGAVTGSLVIATARPKKQGDILALGAAFTSLGVLLFAFSGTYALAFAMLFASGVGISGFATMQLALVLNASTPEMRGRAVGVISLGMGSAPFGVLLVGQLAEYLGPQTALGWMAGAGFVVLLILWVKYPVLRDQQKGPIGGSREDLF